VASIGGNALDISGGSIRLTGATVNAAGACAINSLNAAAVTVDGDVSALGTGNFGICAVFGFNVTVDGNVSAVDGYGVSAYGPSTVVAITGDVSAGGNHNPAVYSESQAVIDVVGNVSATGQDGAGVYVETGGQVSVTGSVSATGTGGVGVRAGSQVSVTGGITTADGAAVYAFYPGTTVTVNGPVSATFATTASSFKGGVDAFNGAAVVLKNNVTVTSVDPKYAGVAVADNATVTIDGKLTALDQAIFINVNATPLTVTDITLPTTKPGYDTYLDSSAANGVVWLKAAAPSAGATSVPTLNEWALAALALLLAGMAAYNSRKKGAAPM
jgi:hypothetical protein